MEGGGGPQGAISSQPRFSGLALLGGQTTPPPKHFVGRARVRCRFGYPNPGDIFGGDLLAICRVAAVAAALHCSPRFFRKKHSLRTSSGHVDPARWIYIGGVIEFVSF